MAVWRPDPRAATPWALALAAAFGVTLAAMNLSFYEAIDRIPLGIAVTLEFVGPLTVGLLGSRRALDLAWVALAAAGIVPSPAPRGRRESGRDRAGADCRRLLGPLHPPQRPDRARFSGGDGLALAMVVSAALLVGPGIAAGGGDLLDAGGRDRRGRRPAELGDSLLARARGAPPRFGWASSAS